MNTEVETVTPSPTQPRKRGNPGRVATHAEISERIDLAISMLCKGHRFNKIVRKLSEHCGISRRMSEIYISHAKAAMVRETGRRREELVAEAYHTYVSIKRRPDAKPRDIIAAQKAICDLLGLEAPKRHRFDDDLRVIPVIDIKHAHERDVTPCKTDDSPPELHPA